MKLHLREKARDDLRQIRDRIAADNPDAAIRFEHEVERTLYDYIARHPEIGARPNFKTRHKALRYWPILRYHDYLVFYEPHEDHVDILRVLHGAQHLPPLL